MRCPGLLPPCLPVLPVFCFPFFFPTHLQLTLPADEMEHFLPAPALITSCIPREIMSLSLCSEPPCPSNAKGAGGGQEGFT